MFFLAIAGFSLSKVGYSIGIDGEDEDFICKACLQGKDTATTSKTQSQPEKGVFTVFFSLSTFFCLFSPFRCFRNLKIRKRWKSFSKKNGVVCNVWGDLFVYIGRRLRK